MPLGADELRAAFLRVFPGVMFAMFLAAIDQTILASALPAIVASLGGFADLSWVVTAYLLAATVAAPFYGHVGDRFGRRITLLTALAVFTIASLACALAPTLWALILARAVQGLGGGGLMTLSQALIGENVPPCWARSSSVRAHCRCCSRSLPREVASTGPTGGSMPCWRSRSAASFRWSPGKRAHRIR